MTKTASEAIKSAVFHFWTLPDAAFLGHFLPLSRATPDNKKRKKLEVSHFLTS